MYVRDQISVFESYSDPINKKEKKIGKDQRPWLNLSKIAKFLDPEIF